jgi:hypothetical protein
LKKIFWLSSFLFYVLACNKKSVPAIIKEIQMPSGYPLNSILQTTDSSIITVGGNNYFTSSIFINRQNSNNWQPVILDAPSNKLFCLAELNNKIYAGGLAGFWIKGNTITYNWQVGRNNNYENINGLLARGDSLFMTQGLSNHGIFINDTFFQTRHSQSFGSRVMAIAFYNDSIGYATTENGILKTTDCGNSFTFTKAKNDIFTDIAILSENKFVACGFAGGIYWSEDGGQTFKTLKTKKHLKPLNKVAYNSAKNKCLVVGDNGQAYAINIATQTCNALPFFTTESIYGVCVGKQHDFLLCGDHGKVWTCDLQ